MDKAFLMRKVAEAAPEKFKVFNETHSEVKDSPFRAEIVEEVNQVLEKAAAGLNSFNTGGTAGYLGRVAGGVGISMAVGVASALAGDMYDAVRRGLTKNRNYKAMLDVNPDLKEHPASDVQRIFSTLHKFNPDFAADPTVAGSFVRQQVNSATFDQQLLNSSIAARKNLKDIKSLDIPGRVPELQDPLETLKTRSEVRRNTSQEMDAMGKFPGGGKSGRGRGSNNP